MGNQQSSADNRLEAAARALLADPAVVDESSADAGLLRYLGYDDGNAALANGRARMLRAAAQFRRCFQLPVPDAPGLIFFGGEADPAVLSTQHAGLPLGNLAGSGLSPQRAFEACVGEGIEYLSQFLQADDTVQPGQLIDFSPTHDAHLGEFLSRVLAASTIGADRSIAWAPVERLPEDEKSWFPVDLCYRRHVAEQDFKPPLKLSSGCAAGITLEAATLRALLELIERDAVALWWRGGRRGRSIPSDSEAGCAAADLLERLRQANTDRKTWLLNITTDVEIPAVAAISARSDGYGFAYGFGARLNLADAARAAIFELCQVELGLHVVAAKRAESGDEKLNEGDRQRLRRGTLFDTRNCGLLQPEAEHGFNPVQCRDDPASGVQHVLDGLTALGIAVYRIDLTRPQFAVPVVRVLAPGLQLDPCEIIGARLARTIDETGGGARHHMGMLLL